MRLRIEGRFQPACGRALRGRDLARGGKRGVELNGFLLGRGAVTRGALSQDTARLMVFKLIMAAAKTWRRLKGENQLPKVVAGVIFQNGVEVTDASNQSAA